MTRPRALPDVARGGGAQLVDAGRRRVAVLAGADRRDGGVLDVDRCRKIGLADAERNDVAALADERIDFGQHDKSVLGAQAFAAPADLRRGLGRSRGAFIASRSRVVA